MKFRIRAELDLSIIEKLDSIVFSEEDGCVDTEGYWWVATYKKEPIAYAGFKLYSTDQGTMAYFHRIGVLPEFRRNGLHKKLIKRRLVEAKKLGVTQVVTYTMYYNVISNNNLINTGFRQYYPDYMWVGVDNIMYWQQLLR